MAAFDDRVIGYTPASTAKLLPFAMEQAAYEDAILNGNDDYSFDNNGGVVDSSPDGINEMILFPLSPAPGNFGRLNIGVGNQGEPAVAEQILNGVTPEQLEAEIGSTELVFADVNSNPVTYEITGNPGITNGLIPELETKIGEVVSFLLYSTAVDVGSNTIYTIVGVRFGRVMEIKLTGNPADRGIFLQPVVAADPGVHTGPTGISSGGQIGRLVLME